MRAPPEKILVIQYMRGIAASLVVLYHVTMMQAVQERFPFHIGQFGVDIFFVISGFVMWTAAGERSPVGFWLARIWRIVPLYWLLTGAFVLGAMLFPQVLNHAREYQAAHIVKSLLFIPARNPMDGEISPIYTIGWSLNYEMFFYLVFGLTLLLKSKAARLACLVAVFVPLAIIGRQLSPDLSSADPLLVFYTRPYLLEFLGGVVLGVAGARLMDVRMAGPVVFAASAMALIGSLLMPATEAQAWVVAIASAGLVAGSLSFERLARRRPSRVLLLAGNASYSIYLAHPLFQRAGYLAVLFVLGGIEGLPRLTVYFVVVLAVGIFGGIATYYLIEKPLLGLRVRRRAALALPRQMA